MALTYGLSPYGSGLYSAQSAFVHDVSGSFGIAIGFPAAAYEGGPKVDTPPPLAISVLFPAAAASSQYSVSGSLGISIGFAGTVAVSTITNVTGALAIKLGFAGRTSEIDEEQANWAINVSFAADPNRTIAGPLWQAAPPCPDPQWAEAELCHG